MRSITIKNAFFMMAAVLGVSYANTASADTLSSNSSTGDAALHYEHTKGLDTTITTGPIGGSKKILGVTLSATVEPLLRIDPVSGSPLFTVDMPRGAQVSASWTGDKKISLKAVTAATTDGNITVRHTITPDVHCNVLGFTFDYKATDLINKIPGARFNYDSQATQAFSPWGFTTVNTVLNAPNLADAQLFDTNIPQNSFAEGDIGIRATTNPTFQYTTTKISLTGADGQIVDASSAVSMNAPDADYFETTVAVEGTMVATGKMNVQPFVHLTHVSALGLNLDLDATLPFTAVAKDYTTAPTVITYPAVNVHIPLPNVHVPRNGVDLGEVKAGGSATKTIVIENSGEKEATLSFKSSDAAFVVPGTQVTVAPKGKYELQVKLADASSGAVSADITVMSNDADSPEQMFKIGANGADVGPTGEDGDLPSSAAAADSGCGCKTAGTSSSIPGYAGFGLLGLGAMVLVRRRRNKNA